MNTNLVHIVKQIIADNGEAVLADPARLKAFFSDLAKDEPKPLRIAFGRCVEAGAYTALKDAPDAAERAERKAAIAQRLRDEHGLDITLCGEALDILEVALFSADSSPSMPMTQRPQPAPSGQYTPLSPSVIYETQTTALPQTVPAKKHTIRNILIASLVTIAVGFCAYFAWMYYSVGPIELDKNNNIIFTQKQNNDQLINRNLTLTLRNVKALIEFIRNNFPSFDFEEKGYVTDDYRNKLRIKDFNDDPKYLAVYLNGISEMAGKSQVYVHLGLLDGELVGFYFSIDQEFSDGSGFEYFLNYFSIIWHNAFQSNEQITSIYLRKYLYSDTNEPYWKIEWGDRIPTENRLALLKGFLNTLRYTKVFKNLGLNFFRDIYTGIEEYQTIEDIVDWYN